MTQSIKNLGSVLVSSMSFDLKDSLSPATTGGLALILWHVMLPSVPLPFSLG